MKKFVSLVIIMTMLFCSSAMIFATDVTTPAEEMVSQRYATASSVMSEVMVSGGTANFYVRVSPIELTSIDYIDATLKLVNSKGTVIKNVTNRIYISGTSFKLSSTKSSIARGTYHTEYTLKVYKSGTLKETIKGKSSAKTY